MRIESIKTTLIDVPTTRELKMSFTTVRHQSYVIVQILTDDGLVGIGEGASVGGPTWSEECAETIKVIIDTYLSPVLIGKDAGAISQLRIHMDRAVTGHRSAKAALDVALHDLQGKALNVPLSDLLGGAVRRSIPIAWTLASGTTSQDIDDAQEMLDLRLHNKFKLKVGIKSPKEDLKHVERIAQSIGGKAAIRVDVNQAWDEITAAQWIPRLYEAGVELVEQPVHRSNFDALHRLTRDNKVPIMADESLSTLRSAYDLAHGHCVNVFSLKLCNAGGVRDVLKIAAVGESASISLYGGTMLDSNLGTAAALHVFSTIPSMPYGCELLGPWILRDSFTLQALEISDFEIQIPDGPGLGIDLDMDKIRQFERT